MINGGNRKINEFDNFISQKATSPRQGPPLNTHNYQTNPHTYNDKSERHQYLVYNLVLPIASI